MRFQTAEETVFLPGGQLDYVVFGAGSRPLVILPGLGLKSVHAMARTFAWMYRIFGGTYRVYVLDRTDPVPESITVEMLADDTAQAMDHLGIREADVIGISLGGMIAQVLALKHPEKVRKLVLGVTLSRVNATFRETLGNWVRAAETGGPEAVVRAMTGKLYSEAYLQKYGWIFPAALKTDRLIAPERFRRLAEACLTCDTYDALSRIGCPVLVLGGKEDRVVTAEASVEMAERLGCPVYLYEGLGHAAYEEGKDFNERILTFLEA